MSPVCPIHPPIHPSRWVYIFFQHGAGYIAAVAAAVAGRPDRTRVLGITGFSLDAIARLVAACAYATAQLPREAAAAAIEMPRTGVRLWGHPPLPSEGPRTSP